MRVCYHSVEKKNAATTDATVVIATQVAGSAISAFQAMLEIMLVLLLSGSILAARSAGHLPWWPGIGAIFATWDRQECAYPPLRVDLAESLGCRIAHAMAHTCQPGGV
jgi:hypothetical protein